MEPVNPNVLASLLSQMSFSDEGKADILKLRAVSKNIKTWIDDNGLRVLAESEEKIKAVIKSPVSYIQNEEIYFQSVNRLIGEIIKNPPSPIVRGLEFHPPFPPVLKTDVERENWSRFLRIWGQRIVHLSLHTLVFPLTIEEQQFISSPGLQTIIIGSTKVDKDRFLGNSQIAIPACFRTVRSAKFMKPLNDVTLGRFLQQLQVNMNLRKLQITVSSRLEILGVQKLIAAMSDRRDLCINLQVLYDEPVSNMKNGNSLWQAIKASESRIHLFGLAPNVVKWLTCGMEEDNQQEVLDKIKTLHFWRKTPGISLDDCRNVEYIGNLCIETREDFEKISNAVTAMKMKIFQSSPYPPHCFPLEIRTLQLQVGDQNLTINFIARIVSQIFDSCRNLQNLGIHVGCMSEETWGSVPVVHPPTQGNHLTTLKP